MLTRRLFVQAASLAALAAPAARPKLCIFSKHMADLDWAKLGAEARAIGFDGVDLTVRDKGHVLPQNATRDLPAAVEAIRGAGSEVHMITTGLLAPSDRAARTILETAAKLGIRYFKPGYWRYKGGVEQGLKEARTGARGLVALAREYGIEAGFHNHSGDYVGSPVWDTREIIRDMDPKWAGYYFDPAHATIEGGLAGWKLSLDLVMPRLKMVALKDFEWSKASGTWKVHWTPLGRGMVDFVAVFERFRAGGFAGPVSLHVEYETADELQSIRSDFAYMKELVAKTYA